MWHVFAVLVFVVAVLLRPDLGRTPTYVHRCVAGNRHNAAGVLQLASRVWVSMRVVGRHLSFSRSPQVSVEPILPASPGWVVRVGTATL